MNALNSTDETTQGVKDKEYDSFVASGKDDARAFGMKVFASHMCGLCAVHIKVECQDICQPCMDKLAEAFFRYLKQKPQEKHELD